MIVVIHASEDIPLYAACDLSRLPPVDLNPIDVTEMSQEKKKLKSNIGNNTFAPTVFNELDSLKGQMAALQTQVGELVSHVKSINDQQTYANAVEKKKAPNTVKDVSMSSNKEPKTTCISTVKPNMPKSSGMMNANTAISDCARIRQDEIIRGEACRR